MTKPGPGRMAGRVGLALSILVTLFLAADAGAKLAQLPQVLEATAQLGFPPGSVRGIGALLLAAVLLYAWPRTAVWGALLLTAYLGAAVAAHVRIGSPWLSHVFFPVYIALMAWAGLVLRRPDLAALLRVR